MSALYDIGVTRIDGTADVMSAYRGKTLLVVNVATARPAGPTASTSPAWRSWAWSPPPCPSPPHPKPTLIPP